MRDSTNDAFFTAESLENLSEALVREAIQNSIDAADMTSGVRDVRIRIRLVPQATGNAKSMLHSLFAGAEKHFESGIQSTNSNSVFKTVPGYFVFEDLGTTGLDGDVEAWRLEDSTKNAFWSFFRAEGRSSKTGDSLGRWGIGKQVFPTASLVNTVFGLTVRTDEPNRVLMGSAVIRSRTIENDDYDPDGWFGLQENTDRPVTPVIEESFLNQFVQAFQLNRNLEKGLSLVVPWVDERMNSDDIRRGIVRNFFWPILQGELVVELEAPEGSWTFNAETVMLHRDLLPINEAAVIDFAAWAAFVKAEQVVKLPPTTEKCPNWGKCAAELLPEDILAELKKHIETGQRFAVEVPIQVRPKAKDATEQASCFRVFFMPCRDHGHRTIFLRDGIVITDIRSPVIGNSRSLVVVDRRPIAGLLGDAEGVNHTQWQKDSPKFHNRYVYGADTIRFVTRSVYEIVQRLHAADRKGDPTLLIDHFFLPADDSSVVEKKTKPKPGAPTPGPDDNPDIPKPKLRRFDIRKSADGFQIIAGNAPPSIFPIRMRIEVGYAVRRGNAIKRWSPDDFQFLRSPLRLEPKPIGVSWKDNSDNTIELEIKQPDFAFGVSGFDRNRDLVVRAIELKHTNETDV